ncbi:MAG: hypothetical protein JW808_01590 [Victivallales bacterium]|nr:hypothetical protein [Victivallales bacterium]
MKGSENMTFDRTRAPDWSEFLALVPMPNKAANIETKDGSVSIEVAVKRPWFLLPPLSWILPVSPKRVVILDFLGSQIWNACDGVRKIEDIVDSFASAERLTFHESRVLITQQLREMVRRGCLVLLGGTT